MMRWAIAATVVCGANRAAGTVRSAIVTPDVGALPRGDVSENNQRVHTHDSPTNEDFMSESKVFDYIVIGSGASGSVIAGRLSESGNLRVLLLEAGEGDASSDIHEIGGFVRLWGYNVDWKFATVPQPGLAGRTIPYSQGKVLGGSTSINAMMYVRGNRGDYDGWKRLGAEGWGYEDVLPYFRKLEDFEGGASAERGSGGPIPVRYCPDAVMRSEEFRNAAVELGYDGPDWDYNGARQENGAGLLQFHIDADGKRASGATAFLQPALSRPNLTVENGAMARRILLEGGRAVGVEYLQNGEVRQARADREVVVSGGAFLSPKLLMLSGLGPADQLRAHGIPVVADLTEVGRNLQDHVQSMIIFRSLEKDRPMTTLLTGNTIFVRTRPGAGTPDLQMNFTPSLPAPLSPFLDFGGPTFIFLSILVNPESRGDVRLASADPAAAPLIDPHYLEHEADLTTLVAAVRLAREMAGTKAFSRVNGGEIAPGENVEAAIRNGASTLWHPAGTCRMGNDPGAVVDARLRVRGVSGLRVADASVMPTVVSGNTVAACFMIGEKCAEMMLAGA